jgi:Asp-tRNA(Asn)/Glu-tRNA(Gln) amidotransferase A subunit family amidase
VAGAGGVAAGVPGLRAGDRATVLRMLAELAAAVRDKRLDPVELVRESLRRIEASQEAVNAVTELRAEEALAEAESHPRDGALAGLPLLVKDMARCKGMRTTMGSPLFASAPVDEVDDTVVARLKDAGAIVVGRTNAPAFGHAAFTSNSLFGATRNPWNLERSPGGSSGGSGAALAAGLVPLATTSDGGGSVRIPASCCGLVGYKPSMGAIGRNVLPRWISFSTQGATGRTVADVVLEASVTLGPAVGDFLSLPRAGVALEPMRPARVLACRTFRADVDPVIEAAFEEALAALSGAGMTVERVASPSEPGVGLDWLTISAAELAQSLEAERDQWDTFEPSLAFQLQYGSQVTASQYIASTRRRHEISARFDSLLGDDAVLVVPTVNVQSWPPEGPLPTSAGSVVDDPSVAVNTVDLNFTGHPAVSVPLGLDDSGVPFGLQVVAPRFFDGLALGLAEALEQVRPWPAVAPGYEPYPLP